MKYEIIKQKNNFPIIDADWFDPHTVKIPLNSKTTLFIDFPMKPEELFMGDPIILGIENGGKSYIFHEAFCTHCTLTEIQEAIVKCRNGERNLDIGLYKNYNDRRWALERHTPKVSDSDEDTCSKEDHFSPNSYRMVGCPENYYHSWLYTNDFCYIFKLTPQFNGHDIKDITEANQRWNQFIQSYEPTVTVKLSNTTIATLFNFSSYVLQSVYNQDAKQRNQSEPSMTFRQYSAAWFSLTKNIRANLLKKGTATVWHKEK